MIATDGHAPLMWLPLLVVFVQYDVLGTPSKGQNHIGGMNGERVPGDRAQRKISPLRVTA